MGVRITFYSPRAGLLTEVVHSVLELVIHDQTLPTLQDVESWTWNERAMAYDWAWRIHLRASDNPVRRRPRPTFTVRRAA